MSTLHYVITLVYNIMSSPIYTHGDPQYICHHLIYMSSPWYIILCLNPQSICHHPGIYVITPGSMSVPEVCLNACTKPVLEEFIGQCCTQELNEHHISLFTTDSFSHGVS